MAALELTRTPQLEVDSLPVVQVDPISVFDYILNSHPEATPTLVGANGERAAFPEVLLDVLRDSVKLLKAGYAVSVHAHDKHLTTQQAANLLDMSRPLLVDLLEKGQIPFERVGNRRRVRLQDLEAYQERRESERRAAFDRLAALGNRATQYDEDF